MTAGQAATGFTHLSDFIDAKVVRRALKWLEIDDDTAPPATGPAPRTSQATQLVAAASTAEPFHTADGDGYAAIEVDSHREIWRLKDREFKRWLAKEYYRLHGRAPSSQAMTDAISVLDGQALYEGPQHDVFVRIARQGDAIYLDLGNDLWQAVKMDLSQTAWRGRGLNWRDR